MLGRAGSRAYHAAENLRGAAAMQQVADWLERLGLSQYARCFAENDISFVILPDLTDQDLLQAYDRYAEAVETITAGMAVYQASRATVYVPFFLSHLSVSYARLGRFEMLQNVLKRP